MSRPSRHGPAVFEHLRPPAFPSSTPPPPSVHLSPEIEYCTGCQWLLRAAWVAQELFTTFEKELGEVAMIPGSGGVFEVRLDGEVVWSREGEGRFLEIKELKQRVRDRAAPGRSLGHSGGRGACAGGPHRGGSRSWARRTRADRGARNASRAHGGLGLRYSSHHRRFEPSGTLSGGCEVVSSGP